jgi:hypothetical protein
MNVINSKTTSSSYYQISHANNMAGTYEHKMLERHRKIYTVGSISIAEILYFVVVSNCEKRLLASLCMSVFLSARPSEGTIQLLLDGFS